MENKKGSGQTIAVVALIAVLILWGFDFVALDYAAAYSSMALFTAMRLSIAAVIMLAYTLIKYKGIPIEKKDWPRVCVIGAVGTGVYFTLEALGIAKIGSPMASLIMTTVPVFGLFCDRIFYKRKITGIKTLGILGSIGGVVLLVVAANEGLTANTSGIIITFAAAIIWTLYVTFSKPIYSKYDLPVAMSGMLSTGALASIPLIFVVDRPVFFKPDTATILILILTAIFAVALCDTLYAYAISKLSVTLVSTSENVIPLVTAIFAWIFLDEFLNIYQIIGGIVIMVSVTVITLKDTAED